MQINNLFCTCNNEVQRNTEQQIAIINTAVRLGRIEPGVVGREVMITVSYILLSTILCARTIIL